MEAVAFEDAASYSDDEWYRWFFERRWGRGPQLCWVGLNPATGDSDGKPRPTLQRMVRRAAADGFGSLRIVNLFSYGRRGRRICWPPTRQGSTSSAVGQTSTYVMHTLEQGGRSSPGARTGGWRVVVRWLPVLFRARAAWG